jgi:ParB family chromosome partitioning protein
MKRKSGLGRGLDALIPRTESEPATGGVIEISVDRITPNPHQPRDQINEERLSELATSIKEYGVIQPLIVTQQGESDNYTLIAGERRLLAAKQAGLSAVPVLVREASELQRLEMALIENLQRDDLTPLETANAYQHLIDDFDLSHSEIASRVGKSRTAVSNTLRLLNLSPSVKIALNEGKISEGHARALLALETPQSQKAALATVLRKDLNVRQTEDLVKQLRGEKIKPKKQIIRSPGVEALEERLRAHLGTKVRLKHGKKGGSVTIYYYSEEELDSLVEHLLE